MIKQMKKKAALSLLAFSLISTTNLCAMTDSSLDRKTMEPTHISGRIVFQSNREGGLSEIWLLENGALKKISSSQNTDKDLAKEIPAFFKNELAGLSRPKWSPDGSKILCKGNDELVLLNPQGDFLKKIKPQKEPHNAIWSPTGKAIYYTAVDFLPVGGGSVNIFRLDLDDNLETRITNLSPLPGVRPILSFAISQDEKEIVYVTMGDDSQGISIWSVMTAGSTPTLLIKFGKAPSWSPDGSKIVYTSNYLPNKEKVSDFEEILLYDVNTKQVSRVTNNKWEDANPVFSPDGTKILFKSARHREITHGSELFIINLDGTSEARLTSPQANFKYPNDPILGWATDEYPDWTK